MTGSTLEWLCVFSIHYKALRIFRVGLSAKEHERVIITEGLNKENAQKRLKPRPPERLLLYNDYLKIAD
jgi:hypothetical protein